MLQINPKKFKISNLKNIKDLSYMRCTVDRKEDLQFVREIWKRKPKTKKILHIDDINKIVEKELELVKINNHIEFDEGYKKSLKHDLETQ